jgi:molybdopterin-guanine dinucleotide biosynthesis protein B
MKVWGIVGWKNTGKTGLTERLVAEFCARGLTVSTVKHAHHAADMDRPGTDSYRHRAAGASEVVLATPARVAILQELRSAPEPGLEALLARLSPVDLVLVEGFKHEPMPKIETHRAETGKPLLAAEDRMIRAVASDGPLDLDVPVLALDDTRAIADFIVRDLAL